MKKLLITMLLIFPLWGLGGCNKDDDQNSQDPVSQLPEATQTGENTFGCLINGEIFTPSGSGFGPPVLDCVYQYVDGGYYFSLQANRSIKNNFQRISLSTENLQIEEGTEYQLLENEEGNVKAGWWYSEQLTYIYTSEEYSGRLTITKLDTENQIVSGTFWFDILLPNGELINVKEGRFDMQFTQ